MFLSEMKKHKLPISIGAIIGISLSILLTLPDKGDHCIDQYEQARFKQFSRIERRIKKMNAKALSSEIADAIMTSHDQTGLDPFLLTALFEQESTFNHLARGANGEKGLAQTVKSTAEDLGINWEDAQDIELSVDAGARYLAMHIRRYKNVRRALERYNGSYRKKEYAQEVLNRYIDITLSQETENERVHIATSGVGAKSN